MMKRWLSHTRVMAARISVRSGAYWADRSSSGTVTGVEAEVGGITVKPNRDYIRRRVFTAARVSRSASRRRMVSRLS